MKLNLQNYIYSYFTANFCYILLNNIKYSENYITHYIFMPDYNNFYLYLNKKTKQLFLSICEKINFPFPNFIISNLLFTGY